MAIVLETERLYLREIEESDHDAIFRLDSDPAVHKYIFNNPIKTMDQACEQIQYIRKQYRENGCGRLAMILKETNKFLGWAGIKVEHNVNNHERFYDLGFRIMPQYWNKGYTSEVTFALLKHGFEVLKLDVICGYAFTAHLASRKVFEKTGFREVETFFADGDDNVWFEYRKDDYLSRQASVDQSTAAVADDNTVAAGV